MQLLQLNTDVLDAILNLLGKRSLVAFMSTSRTAYEAGFFHLVTSVDLRYSLRQVFDFSRFMLLEKHSHRTLPMLRSLQLYGAASAISIVGLSDAVSSGLDALARLIEQACNLQTLRIVDIEHLLIEPRISNSITHHPRLTAIYFTAADKHSFDTISGMRSLRHIHISHNDDLIPIIRPFRSTLETLSSEYRFFRNDKDFRSLLSDTEDVWPRVHTLNLGLLSIPIHLLVRAFPNLRRLRLQAVKRLRFGVEYHATVAAATATAAVEAAAAAANHECCCWPSLDYVEVSISGLCELALTCPIRQLHLTMPPDIKFWQNDNWFTTLREPLRRAAPRALSFPAMMSNSNVNSSSNKDETTFSQLAIALPNLRVLGLSYVYDPVSTLQRLTHIFWLLHKVPLGYLTLEFSRPTPITHSPSDILIFLSPIFSIIPSIQVVELQLHGSPRLAVFGVKPRGICSWWKVVRHPPPTTTTTNDDDDDDDGCLPGFEQISEDLGLRFRALYVAG